MAEHRIKRSPDGAGSVSVDDPTAPPPELPVIAAGHTYTTVTDKISQIVLTRPLGKRWLAGMMITSLLVMVLTYAVGYLLARGIGIWGNNVPVGWGFDIINFVWWIGIGHAGTFISAFRLLL